MSKIHVTTTVNGDPAEFLTDPGTTLLDALRDELGLTGTKEGCGSGDCGACSVMVDGRLVCSCLVLAAEAEGRRIETIEGMAQGGELHPLQQKFLEHAALQCGFCTPGPAGRGQGAARRQPRSDRGGNPLLAGRQPLPLHRLRQDHPRRARRRRGAQTRTEGRMSDVLDRPTRSRTSTVVGTRPIRPDGLDKVTGRAQFGADFAMPGMLLGRDPAQPARPRAHRLASTPSKALALPGVKAVVTGADFPDLADGADRGRRGGVEHCATSR